MFNLMKAFFWLRSYRSIPGKKMVPTYFLQN